MNISWKQRENLKLMSKLVWQHNLVRVQQDNQKAQLQNKINCSQHHCFSDHGYATHSLKRVWTKAANLPCKFRSTIRECVIKYTPDTCHFWSVLSIRGHKTSWIGDLTAEKSHVCIQQPPVWQLKIPLLLWWTTSIPTIKKQVTYICIHAVTVRNSHTITSVIVIANERTIHVLLAFFHEHGKFL